jgi:hypothetical protein
MGYDLAIFFEQVAAIPTGFGLGAQVFPLQQIEVGVMVRAIKLVDADKELREGREILGFGRSNGCAH